MASQEIIPTHEVAVWLLGHIRRLLNAIGFEHHAMLETVVYVIVVMALSILVGLIVKTLVLQTVRKIVALRGSVAGKQLLQQRTLTKCAHVITPLVFMALVPFAFANESKLLDIVQRATAVYALVALGIGICAVLTFIYSRYDERENTRNLPLRGILNIAHGIVWVVIVIVAVSVVVDKSPAVLLTGLGAFAAALMLIFKDSILGFVAGVQMSQNDMLHVGDWIVVPGTDADGVVIDVSLTAVKVQNFDNTIVTVPPYTLVSTSFRNYRGMVEGGCRRFVHTITVIPSSIVRCTPEFIKEITGKFPEMASFVDSLQGRGASEQNDGGLTPVNGTLDTNLGLYRAYLAQWLLTNPDISKKENILVQYNGTNDNGYILQVYAFTATTEWASYEAITSDVMEHVAVTAADFGLRIYSRAEVAVDTRQIPANND